MTVSLTQATGAGLSGKSEGGKEEERAPEPRSGEPGSCPQAQTQREREGRGCPSGLDDASHPLSMFQIPEFEPSEQEDGPEEGSSACAPGEPRELGRHSFPAQSRPGHRPEPGTHHREASSTGADRRPRLISYPPLREGSGEASPEAEAEVEGSEGEEERGLFRSRSSSAPPILWAARRYGSELRRMSDEFDCTFKGLPRPKSASTASQMRRSHAWTRTLQSWFTRNLGKGAAGPTH